MKVSGLGFKTWLIWSWSESQCWGSGLGLGIGLVGYGFESNSGTQTSNLQFSNLLLAKVTYKSAPLE